jgi:Zn-dependent protease
MRGGFRIGRIFGINIYVDWSWLIIFLLVTWNLGGLVFPTWQPGWGPALSCTMAVIASLVFFASVLVHELSHSLVAKARGLPVRRITLFLLGGVANIEREPPSPRTEFLMAIVGPISSILLGIIFLALGVAAAGMPGPAASPGEFFGQLGPLATILFWLGPINILIGVFNMIPGFPLDGGRVLRSILWAIMDDLRRATKYASWAGRGIALLFIFAGIAMAFGVPVPIFGTGLLGGLWLAFIGWFLYNAATQSYQQVVIRDMLEGIPVSRLMRPDPRTVPVDISVGSLVYDHIMAGDERTFIVMDNGRVAGLVALEDARQVPRDEWDTRTVADVMTPAERLATVSPREDASDALQKFMVREVRQMPVMENNNLVGVLRMRDLMRWLQMHSEFGGEFQR